MTGQCLDRRIPDEWTLTLELIAWESRRNQLHRPIVWSLDWKRAKRPTAPRCDSVAHSFYPKGLEAARYIGRYLGYPPLATSHITAYDGQQVTYWYIETATDQRITVICSALDFLASSNTYQRLATRALCRSACTLHQSQFWLRPSRMLSLGSYARTRRNLGTETGACLDELGAANCRPQFEEHPSKPTRSPGLSVVAHHQR